MITISSCPPIATTILVWGDGMVTDEEDDVLKKPKQQHVPDDSGCEQYGIPGPEDSNHNYGTEYVDPDDVLRPDDADIRMAALSKLAFPRGYPYPKSTVVTSIPHAEPHRFR